MFKLLVILFVSNCMPVPIYSHILIKELCTASRNLAYTTNLVAYICTLLTGFFASCNQGKIYTFFILTQWKSTWKQQKFRENSGKSKIQNCCEPWHSHLVNNPCMTEKNRVYKSDSYSYGKMIKSSSINWLHDFYTMKEHKSLQAN